MASIQRFSLLAGGAAATLAIMLPAQAEDVQGQSLELAGAVTPMSASVEQERTAQVINTPDTEGAGHQANELDAAVLSGQLAASEAIATDAPVASQPLDVATLDLTGNAADLSAATTASAFSLELDPAEAASATTGQEVAQVTRPLYRGVTPFYLGVGGNIGLVDSDESAIGDFGFSVISKISLGPRFSVRPTLNISEDDLNLAVPLTYNFNPIEVREFSVYPSVGAGVDVGDDVGLLINGGIDIPVSRDFTLNGQINWRATSDVGVGVSLGIGYNFPFFFE